jgi:hypothetical protein
MSRSLAAFTLCALATAASAQTVRTPVAPEPLAVPGQVDMMKLQTAMMAAQQAAIKPGDEALPCEALQKELVSSMTSPALQAYAAKTNPAYAKELAALQPKGVMTPAAAAALAASLSSGAAMTGMPQMPMVTGQQMNAQQMQQAMLAQQQAAVAYMNQMAPIMPTLMRSQRVMVLAGMKNCAWVTGGLGLVPNMIVPTAIPPEALAPRQK